jgi:hypothetical protein
VLSTAQLDNTSHLPVIAQYYCCATLYNAMQPPQRSRRAAHGAALRSTQLTQQHSNTAHMPTHAAQQHAAQHNAATVTQRIRLRMLHCTAQHKSPGCQKGRPRPQPHHASDNSPHAQALAVQYNTAFIVAANRRSHTSQCIHLTMAYHLWSA